MSGAMAWAKTREPQVTTRGNAGVRTEDPVMLAHHKDTGCPDGTHPSCLNCPLEVCRYDDQAFSPWRLEKSSKLEAIASALADGVTVDGAAEMHGVSRRTVFRVLSMSRDGIPLVKATEVEGGRRMTISTETVGKAALSALRQTLEGVTAAESVVHEAERALAEARSAASSEVRKLGEVLRALDVVVPSELSESMRLIMKSAPKVKRVAPSPSQALASAASSSPAFGEPFRCGDCPRQFASNSGMAIHRARAHKAA